MGSVRGVRRNLTKFRKRGEVELAPALPKEWKSGRVKGLVARTGETVSYEWKDGKVTRIF